MAKLEKLVDFFLDKDYRFMALARKGFYDSLSDKDYVIRESTANIGYTPNIENPVSFNDKMQWLKLYDRNPFYSKLVDKYSVREFVEEKIGLDSLIPLVGGPWKSVDDIDIDALPNQFVLKCTHDSGGVFVCKDKASFNWNSVKGKLAAHLSKNYFYQHREWPYKNVKPLIIAEAYLHNEPVLFCDYSERPSVSVDYIQSRHGLVDYKITCFNGKARLFMIFVGVLGSEMKSEDYFENVYDEHFSKLDILDCFPIAAPQYPQEIEKPPFFEEMIEKAEKLASGIPLVRVDFYHSGNFVKFGEMTLYPDAGMTLYKPDHWDRTLGSWLQLPESKTL